MLSYFNFTIKTPNTYIVFKKIYKYIKMSKNT